MGTAASGHTIGIEDWTAVEADLYRIWVIFSTTTDLQGHIHLYLADGDGDVTIANDGTSTLYAGYGQLEHAATIDRPTSYIPTAGSTVTRAVDDLARTSDFSFHYQAEGSCYIDYTPYYHDDDNQRTLLHLHESSTQYIIGRGTYLVGSRTGQAYWLLRDSTQAVLTGTDNHGIATGVRNRQSVTWENLGFGALYLDGVQDQTEDPVYVPDNPTHLQIGSTDANAAPMHALIHEFAWFDNALSQSQGESLTNDGTFPAFGATLLQHPYAAFHPKSFTPL